MPAGGVGLAPWFVVLFWVLRFGLPLALLVMTIDTLRRPSWHFRPSVLASRNSWFVQNVAVLLLLFVSILGGLANHPVQRLGFLFVPLGIVQGFRYLLTVVFPSQKRLAERAERGEAARP